MRVGRVLGTPVAATTRAEACDDLERWIAERRREYVVLANVHLVETGRARSFSRRGARGRGCRPARRGAGGVVCATSTGSPAERVTGSDVFEGACRRSLSAGYRHFFYGSSPETVESLERVVGRQHPGISICGSISPPCCASHQAPRGRAGGHQRGAARHRLGRPRRAQAGAVDAPGPTASRGSPPARGRRRIRLRERSKRRAPDLLQQLGLEWAYRLAQEPRRLGRRYLTTNTSFTVTTLRSLLFGGQTVGRPAAVEVDD